MKKQAIALVTLGVAAALALTGCGGGGRTTTPTTAAPPASSGAEATSAAPVTGFPADSTIGVSLPQKTSENWVLAEGYFNDGLKAAGYKPMVTFADGGVPEQQNQIQSMITAGAKVIVIGAIDGSQLGTQLAAAKAAGITIIAYDRLLTNTPDVDMYIAYDPCQVGKLQGQALLDGLAAQQGKSPWNIEMIAGSPDDANSTPFFQCAFNVIKPKIDDGTLVIPSGQTTQDQVATPGWDPKNVQTRFDTIMSGFYTGGKVLNGILSPNDTLARAAVTSALAAGQKNPVVTGQDSEVESVQWIADGKQYSTINKDTKTLVNKVIEVIGTLQQGKTVEFNDTTSYNNGKKVVPAFALTPIIVTKDNLCTTYDPSTGAGQAAAATALCKK